MKLTRRQFSFLVAMLALPVAQDAARAQEFGRGLGLLPTDNATLSHLENLRIVPAQAGERPARLELRKYMPPVGDQGQQGSCVGWSTAYYMYTYALAKRQQRTSDDLANPKFQGSPAFIYNRPDRRWENGREISPGMHIFEAIQTLEEKGWASMAEMPYDEREANRVPDASLMEKAARRRAQRTKALPFETTGIEEIKTYLATVQLPIVLAIPVYSDFHRIRKTGSDYVYELTVPKDSKHGWHAVAICGYDETRKALLMVNSWGADFGDNGYLWLSEDFVRENAREAWGVMPGGLLALGAKQRISVVPPSRR